MAFFDVLMSRRDVLVLFHPDIQLIDGGDEDEQREAYSHQRTTLRPKNLRDSHVGILIDACQQVGYRIVTPVVYNTWYDTARTFVHPSKE